MSPRSYFQKLRYFDWLMLSAVLLLCAFSLAALYGIATGFEPLDLSNLSKQIVFIALGIAVMLIMASFNPLRFSQYATFGYLGGGLLLCAVLWFGQTLRGTTGWFTFAGLGFQPVEVAKLALIVMLARLFSQGTSDGKLSGRTVLSSAALTAVYVGLALLQPDFGSAVVLIIIWFGMLIFCGVSMRQVAVIAALLLAMATVGWGFFLKDYQRGRIISFLQPAADPYGRGYQVRQSIIAVGAGQFLGRGLGFGSQSQLKFLPASQTDFIFAVIAEELGFLGAGAVIAAYFVLFYRLLVAARRAGSDFSATLILGIGVLLFAQVMINIGMNIGMLPVTGIGLPFLSYGGSYLVITFSLLGMAQAVSIASVKYRA